MDVFGIAAGVGGEFLRDAVIGAAHDLGVFAQLSTPYTLDALADAIGVGTGRRRLRPLLDVLVALGHLARDATEQFVVRAVPPRPVVAKAGWGLMADVIRTDTPLPVEGGAAERRMHEHLATAGAAAAREVAQLLIGHTGLLDLGGGAGAYTQAFLETDPQACARLVDFPEVVAHARERLAPLGERVSFVASEITVLDATTRPRHVIGQAWHQSLDVALLANVLHLHGREMCARLVRTAARAVEQLGGKVVIKDLRVDDGRTGPLEGLLFALNMAMYTGEGDVYETHHLRAWLEDAGLEDIREHRLATSPNAIVVIGQTPEWRRRATWVFGDQLPRQLRLVMARAEELGTDTTSQLTSPKYPELRDHYTRVMPQMRRDQLAHPLFRAPLHWDRLPRLRDAIDRLFDVLARARIDVTTALGAANGEAFRARTPDLATLHSRTHYGAAMPMLYGYPADLAYFESRGLGTDELIDRYLTAPVVHELCHLDRERDALVPHLDECVAGWLGVHVWPEFAYPAAGQDDAIYASPWLAQIGQAMVRVFGERAVLRAHAGVPEQLPREFVVAARDFYWADWQQRRTLHFLSDTLDPGPWLRLIFEGRPLRENREADRAIVADALRAMCLVSDNTSGSFRTRTEVPTAPIVVEAGVGPGDTGRMTTAPKNAHDIVPPAYWLPPCVTYTGELTVASVDEIPGIAARLVP